MRRAVPEQYRPIGYLTRLVQERTANRVRLGPFAGMYYIDRAVNSAYLPKLLGTYERELIPIIERICRCRPSLIIDIGAAEGYYAVGFARRNPQAMVVAFERDPVARTALERTCWLNGVRSGIEICGECGAEQLEAALKRAPNEHLSKGFVMCDVEGDEKLLLDPIAIPALRWVNLVVETHEFVHAGITQELRGRFAATHNVRTIWQESRTGSEFPFKTLGTTILPKSYLDWAMSEWRPERMSWLWMQPHD